VGAERAAGLPRIVNPMIDGAHGLMRWPTKAEPGLTVARQRMAKAPPADVARMRAHPSREWLVVLSGTGILLLGNRRLRRGVRLAVDLQLPPPIQESTRTWQSLAEAVPCAASPTRPHLPGSPAWIDSGAAHFGPSPVPTPPRRLVMLC
jgi:hypothetical protein